MKNTLPCELENLDALPENQTLPDSFKNYNGGPVNFHKMKKILNYTEHLARDFVSELTGKNGPDENQNPPNRKNRMFFVSKNHIFFLEKPQISSQLDSSHEVNSHENEGRR